MRLNLDNNSMRVGAALAYPGPPLTGGHTPVRTPVVALGERFTALPNHPYALVRRPMR